MKSMGTTEEDWYKKIFLSYGYDPSTVPVGECFNPCCVTLTADTKLTLLYVTLTLMSALSLTLSSDTFPGTIIRSIVDHVSLHFKQSFVDLNCNLSTSKYFPIFR